MQRAVLYVKKHGSYSESVACFGEEDVEEDVWLSDNYDSVKGATDWAQKTLVISPWLKF